MNRPLVISTRRLSPAYVQRFMDHGYRIEADDYIAIQYTDLDLYAPLPSHIVITSKNAILALKAAHQLTILDDKIVYCVGKTSAELLHHTLIKRLYTFSNGSDLTHALKLDGVSQIGHLCGNKTLPTFTQALQASGIACFSYPVYMNTPTPRKVAQQPAAVLFFSPSGVESYFTHNLSPVVHAICIGTTTESAAKSFSKFTHVAPQTTMSSVVETALNILNP